MLVNFKYFEFKNKEDKTYDQLMMTDFFELNKVMPHCKKIKIHQTLSFIFNISLEEFS